MSLSCHTPPIVGVFANHRNPYLETIPEWSAKEPGRQRPSTLPPVQVAETEATVIRTTKPGQREESILSNFRSAAQFYANKGWPVIPMHSIYKGQCTCVIKWGKEDCNKPGKHPLISDWRNKASTDLDVLQKWWMKWPWANVAIVTGAQTFEVLDIDGDEGFQLLKKLEREHSEIPDTFEAESGSGGWHIFFQPSGKVKGWSNVLPGMDTRAEGNCIIVQPSRHVSGGLYEWKCDPAATPLAPWPEWLLEKILESRKRQETKGSHKRVSGHLINSLTGLAGVSVGQRDNDLFRYACQLRSKRMNRAEAEVLVLKAAANCDPPFPAEEALRKVESAWNYKSENPYQVPIPELWGDIGAAIKNEEIGDARLLAHEFKEIYCFDHSNNIWFEFNGNYWTQELIRDPQKMPDRLIELYGDEFMKISDLAKKAAEKGDQEDAKRLKAMADKLLGRIRMLQKRARRKNVVALATEGANTLGLGGTEWDLGPWDLAVANGVIDLKTGEKRPGRPEDYIKTAVPTKWDGLDIRPKRWINFLEEIFSNNCELIAYLQRLLGMALVGEVYEHILPIFSGKGRNGKGTLLEVLKYVLGPVAAATKPEMLMEEWRTKSAAEPSPDILALKGKRLVWGSESSRGHRFNTSKVKLLTGGDTLVGRPLYSNKVIEFKPTHTLILMTNYKPKADAADYAFWKRVHVVPFELSFVDEPKADYERKADTKLPEKLKKEAPRILAWLVQGCLSWQARGMRLEPPEAVKVATEAYQCEADDIRRFIEDICLLADDLTCMLKLLHPKYENWCKEEGIKHLGKNTFAKRLEEMGFSAHKDPAGRKVFSGLDMKEEED